MERITSTVFVVLNDASLRRDLELRLSESGYEPLAFETGESFLDYVRPISQNQRCLVSEFCLPQMTGLELLDVLQARKIFLPTLFYDEAPSLADAIHAIQKGAIDVIQRQPGHACLISAVEEALRFYLQKLPQESRRRDTLAQLRTLNDGEHQVLDGIMRGMMNKEIARSLKLSIRTIEQRRRQVFRKLRVQHPAELAQRVMDATHVPIDHTIKDHSQPLRSDFLTTV